MRPQTQTSSELYTTKVEDVEEESADIRADKRTDGEEDIDILSSSLSTLYSYTPITHAAAGDTFVYDYDSKTRGERDEDSGRRFKVELQTPDTSAKNWSLHASSIWVSAVYLADHIHDLNLDDRIAVRVDGDEETMPRMEVLELGAGAGLPGILIAKYLESQARELAHRKRWRVTLSDYPDGTLIQTLRANASRNGLSPLQCRVVPYAWGEDVSSLLLTTGADAKASGGFDLIVAADVVWNAEMHDALIQSLRNLLRRTKDARIHLVAGLHTGRYTIRGFLQAATKDFETQDATCLDAESEVKSLHAFRSFETERVEEREVVSSSIGVVAQKREWSADRIGEDEVERRRWVVWIVLKWKC